MIMIHGYNSNGVVTPRGLVAHNRYRELAAHATANGRTSIRLAIVLRLTRVLARRADGEEPGLERPGDRPPSLGL